MLSRHCQPGNLYHHDKKFSFWASVGNTNLLDVISTLFLENFQNILASHFPDPKLSNFQGFGHMWTHLSSISFIRQVVLMKGNMNPVISIPILA